VRKAVNERQASKKEEEGRLLSVCRKGLEKPIRESKERKKGRYEKNRYKKEIRNGCHGRAVESVTRVDTGSIAKDDARDDPTSRDREWGVLRVADGVLVAKYAA